MRIEARGPKDLLEPLRLCMQDQLDAAGYREGPKYSSIDAGVLIDYTRGDFIVGIQLKSDSESGDNILIIESEREIADLNKLWDSALIAYGREVFERLQEFAIDKHRVKEGLK